MKKIIKNNYKIIIGIIIGILISLTSVYAIEAYIESKKVSYDNHNKKITTKENVQEAIDELYERSGIHQEKWVDPVLNGADPVLKEPLIPVEIKPNGDVYYANLNSEWYNYSEKRWANAIILTDTAKEYKDDKKYKVGDQIKEDDIESYFVWIPRYQYKVWDLGKYNDIASNLTNTQDTSTADSALWKIAGNNSKLIDIQFGTYEKYPKMAESAVKVDEYYTHPAFTLGDKNLNGIWVGKFEIGYKNANSTSSAEVNKEESNNLIVKPNVYSWRGVTVKNIFMTAYNYKNIENKHNDNIDPHMLRNVEWGATAYLSHSIYGIGAEVNANNNSEYKTGYSATANSNQRIYQGETGKTSEKEKTQPWNTTVGYLASTTGNITGIYDMSGGAWEYMAACAENPSDSGFDINDLNKYFNLGYIDKYPSDSDLTTYNKRILGDATGEIGPFYYYFESNGVSYHHSSWYADYAEFVGQSLSWFPRGGCSYEGVLNGQFSFGRNSGGILNNFGSRLALAPTK